MRKDLKPIAIFINDIHFGKENLIEAQKNWDEMLDLAESFGIVDIFVGGDMFLSRVSQTLSVLLTVQSCIKKAVEKGMNVWLAPGNHDKVSLEDYQSYCHVFNGINGLHVIDHYQKIEYPEVSIHLMPYFPESGSFKERLKTVETDPDVKNILYIHEGINGALAHSDENSNKELPTHLFDRFDLTLVGHYHNRTHIKGTKIHYIGSSRQHNFGEDTDKGYTLIYEDGSFRYFLNKVNPKYITFTEDFSDIDKAFMFEITEAAKQNCKVRVIINCEPGQRKLINKQDFVLAGATKVEIKETSPDGEETEQTTGSVRFNKDGLKKSYLSFYEGRGSDAEFGLKYLDLINM